MRASTRIALLWGMVLVASPGDAHAYIDPGSGALILQLLMAALFGALFFIRSIRAWVREKLDSLVARITKRKQG